MKISLKKILNIEKPTALAVSLKNLYQMIDNMSSINALGTIYCEKYKNEKWAGVGKI